jgi:Ankyrin repeat
VLYGADVNSVIRLDKGSPVVPLHVAAGKAVEFGWTPLIYAISREDVDAIRVLVRHGAKVNTERTTRYKGRVRSGEEKLVVGT